MPVSRAEASSHLRSILTFRRPLPFILQITNRSETELYPGPPPRSCQHPHHLYLAVATAKQTVPLLCSPWLREMGVLVRYWGRGGMGTNRYTQALLPCSLSLFHPSPHIPRSSFYFPPSPLTSGVLLNETGLSQSTWHTGDTHGGACGRGDCLRRGETTVASYFIVIPGSILFHSVSPRRGSSISAK